MTCQECKDLLPLFALDALETHERDAVSAHLLSGCDECRSYLSEMKAVVDVLPLSVAPVTPPLSLRERLMSGVAFATAGVAPGDLQSAPRRPSKWVHFRDALVGGAVAAGIMAVLLWQQGREQRKAIALLREQLRQTQTDIGELRSSAARMNGAIQMLQSPAIQLVSLEGTAVQPSAKARAFWDESRKALSVYVAGLRALPAGKTYELWVIDADQKKFAAGTFNADANGEAVVVAHPTADAQKLVALAVTDEPFGGSTQPTGQIQLVGKVQ